MNLSIHRIKASQFLQEAKLLCKTCQRSRHMVSGTCSGTEGKEKGEV